MNLKKENRDYFEIIFVTFAFMIFYFGADFLKYSSPIKYGIIGLGTFLSSFIYRWIRPRSFVFKITASVILFVISTGGVYLLSTPKGEVRLGGNSIAVDDLRLNGIWKTDDTDDLIIKFRIQDDLVFLSMSPDFEEIEYSFELKNQSISLFEGNEMKFSWDLVVLSFSEIELMDGEETMKLTRIAN
ncbi:MAG: hypothetical protein OEY56_07940 [Cyclobacteriaceae bacterium]|nr:hypothetical protein [Cyclobacteriaceae bacterium]